MLEAPTSTLQEELCLDWANTAPVRGISEGVRDTDTQTLGREILELPPKGLRVNEPRAQESSGEETEQGGLWG